MKKIVLLFIFIISVIGMAAENVNNYSKSYDEQILEKKINELVEKKLQERLASDLKSNSNSNQKNSETDKNENYKNNSKEENKENDKNKVEKENKEKENNVNNKYKTDKENGEKEDIEVKEIELFGKKMFNNESFSAAPSEVSAGKDYILSSGDVIRLALWSDSVSFGKDGIIEIKIAANGVAAIPDLGAFTLRGKTIEDAENEIITRGLRKLRDFKANISLVQMRSVNIFVLGEVTVPGSYNLPPMADIITAIYKAGGITDSTSLRNIKILREGKTITVDLYDYLLKGEKNKSFNLMEGDTIFVPTSSQMAIVTGNVVRKGIYELKGKTTLKELIDIAGGLTPDAFIEGINVKRKSSNKLEILTVKDISSFDVEAGDEIEIGGKDLRAVNGVLLKGNVVRPGIYEVKPGEKFSDILEKAGGFKKETFTEKIDLIRVKDDMSLIKNSFNGKIENPELKGEDTITVYSITDAVAKKIVRVAGEVKKPGSYEIYENSRVSDLLFNAGGVNEETAYFGRADIVRIDENGNLTVVKVDLGKILSGNKEADILVENYDSLKIYSLKDSKIFSNIYIYGEVRDPKEYEYLEDMTISDAVFYAKGMKISADRNNVEVVRSSIEGGGISSIVVNINDDPNFKLREYDQIFIRKIPNWEEKKIVKIKGYVKYPGEYSVSNNETLNELIKRAGGYKEGAFPEGINFYRNHRFKDELAVLNMKFEEDILKRERLIVTNLDYSKKKAGFIQDIILKDGDEIEIPEIPHVVKVMGEVYRPGMVVYEKGRNLNYYVESSGGYTEKAFEKKAFIVKYNGKTEKNGWFKKVKVEAGDTVIVPKDERVKKSFWEVVGATVDFIAKLATTYAVVHSVTN